MKNKLYKIGMNVKKMRRAIGLVLSVAAISVSIASVTYGNVFDTNYPDLAGYHPVSVHLFEKEIIDSRLSAPVEEAKSTHVNDHAIKITETIGNVSDDFVQSVNDQFINVPEGMLTAFTESGWHLYVSEYDVDDTYAGGRFGRVRGLTCNDRKIIYIDYREVAITAVLHEFGHWYDDYLGHPALGSDFSVIYNHEFSRFVSAYNFDNGAWMSAEEFFAEAFSEYFIDAGRLQESCPEIYNYMNSLVGNMYI